MSLPAGASASFSPGGLGKPCSARDTLQQQSIDESLGVRADLSKDDAHSRWVLFDAYDLAEPLDGLDVVHDDREPKVDLRAHRERSLRPDEDSGPRDIGHILLNERIER